jgi:hypothetical protein
MILASRDMEVSGQLVEQAHPEAAAAEISGRSISGG